MTLGQRVRSRRVELGLSQAQLGELIHKDKSRISRLEADEWIPDKETLHRLALALQTNTAHLSGADTVHQPSNGAELAHLASLAAENAQLKQRLKEGRSVIAFLERTVRELLQKVARGGGLNLVSVRRGPEPGFHGPGCVCGQVRSHLKLVFGSEPEEFRG